MTKKQKFDHFFYEFVAANNEMALIEKEQALVNLLSNTMFLPGYAEAKLKLKKAVARMEYFYIIMNDNTIS